MNVLLQIWHAEQAIKAVKDREEAAKKNLHDARLAFAQRYAKAVRERWKRAGKISPIIHKEYRNGEATKDRSTD